MQRPWIPSISRATSPKTCTPTSLQVSITCILAKWLTLGRNQNDESEEAKTQVCSHIRHLMVCLVSHSGRRNPEIPNIGRLYRFLRISRDRVIVIGHPAHTGSIQIHKRTMNFAVSFLVIIFNVLMFLLTDLNFPSLVPGGAEVRWCEVCLRQEYSRASAPPYLRTSPPLERRG